MTKEPKLVRERPKKTGIPKKINGKKVIKVIDWKIWYDEITKSPVGSGFVVAVAGPDEPMPYHILREPLKHCQIEHKAVMLVLEN